MVSDLPLWQPAARDTEMRVGTQNWLIPKSGHWMVFFTCQYILLQAPSHAWNHFLDILRMALWRSLQQRQFPRPLSEQSLICKVADAFMEVQG